MSSLGDNTLVRRLNVETISGYDADNRVNNIEVNQLNTNIIINDSNISLKEINYNNRFSSGIDANNDFIIKDIINSVDRIKIDRNTGIITFNPALAGGPGGGISNLSNLSDVSTTGMVGNDVLFYNSSTSNFQFTNKLTTVISNTCNVFANNNMVSIGCNSGTGLTVVNLGIRAGVLGGSSSISIGSDAGSNSAELSLNAGFKCGSNSRLSSVNVGVETGSNSGANSVQIGYFSGAVDSGSNSVSISKDAGSNLCGHDSVNIGQRAGHVNINNSAGSNTINIGCNAGTSNCGSDAVNLAKYAGYANCGNFAVNCGYNCGNLNSGVSSIQCGDQAGSLNSGNFSINCGKFAGYDLASLNSISIGNSAGCNSNGVGSIQCGYLSGASNSGLGSLQVGEWSGHENSGDYSIQLGFFSGFSNSSSNSISIGNFAGSNQIGVNSICLGNLAGCNSCGSNTIVLNASNVHLSPTNSNGFYVNPVRLEESYSNYCNVKYNPTLKEIVYQNQYFIKTAITSNVNIAESSASSNYLSTSPTINIGFSTPTTANISIPVDGIYSIKALVGVVRDPDEVTTTFASTRYISVKLKINSTIRTDAELVLIIAPNQAYDRQGGLIENILSLSATDTVSIVLQTLETLAGVETSALGYVIVHKIM